VLTSSAVAAVFTMLMKALIAALLVVAGMQGLGITLSNLRS